MRKHRLLTALLGATVIFGTTAASAQEPTHIETTAAEAATAAQEPGGGDGSFIDRLRTKGEAIAENTQLADRLNGDIDGWYPRLGGMTRGGGFALGPGYRLHVFDDRIFVDLSAGISLKGYQAADAHVRWLRALDDRLELWTDFRYEHFPQEDFYGMGFDSLTANETSYTYNSTDLALRGLFKPVDWVRLGTTFGYLRPALEAGTDSRVPSVEQLFTDAEAPGLAGDPRYLHTTFFAEVERRDIPGNPTSGGFYRASFGIMDDHDLDAFDHRRLDTMATYYVPVSPGRTHVLSARLGTSYVNNETGQRVPFYVLPYVGGVDTIRSFNEFRFKDENAMWLGAEYKWRAFEHVSLVGFFDAGKVTGDWETINFSGLRKGYGFGFRAHTNRQTLARLDFGTGGGEGLQVFLKLGPSF